MKTSKSFYTTIALVIGIFLCINLISDQLHLRLDLTQDNRYTLSPATRTILNNLEEPVTVKAYFTEGLPPQFSRTRQEFQELLVEYASRSGDMVLYEFIDPTAEGETDAEQEAQQNGIAPLNVQVRKENQMQAQRAYMGAIVEKGEQKDVIPFLQPGAAMEYALSTSIKKISVLNKPSVGFVQGHGEAPFSSLQQVSQSLSILYNAAPYSLSDATSIPNSFSALAIIAPSDSFPASHLTQLDAYLAQGGKLMIALNRVGADLQQSVMGTLVNTGLETWLQTKGIAVESSFLLDEQSGAVSAPRQMGPFQVMEQIPFPYIPIVNQYPEHPITQGLGPVGFPFASPLRFTGDSTLTFTPIIVSSGKSGTASAPTYFDISKQWTESDFPLSHLTMGAAVEGNFGGNVPTKMVIIGDGDFAIPQQQGQGVAENAVNLLVNSIDWLSDDTGLIQLRTKGLTFYPLDEIETSTQNWLKGLNFLLPILLILAYGIIRWRIKRSVRIKRSKERYV